MQISKNDTHVTLTENKESLSLNEITFDDTGNYRCVVTNGLISSYMDTNLIVIGMYGKIFYCFRPFILRFYPVILISVPTYELMI